jgi:hypothetical protein
MIRITLALTAPLLLVAPLAAADVFTQKPAAAPSVERGAPPGTPPVAEASWQQKFTAGPTPLWVWGTDTNKRYFLRKEFAADKVTAAKVKLTCDNHVTLTLNGQQVVASDMWQEPAEADVTKLLKPGGNVLVAEVRNDDGPAGFVLKLVMTAAGETKYVVSDTSWTAAETKDGAGVPAQKVATYGDQPWGRCSTARSPGRARRPPRTSSR